MTKLPEYSEVSRRIPIEAKIGQLFMPAAFINDSEAHIQRLEQLIRTHHIGSICFFHSPASAATNFEGKKEVPYNADSLSRLKELIDRYQAAAEYPLVIAMDAEWGLAMRVEATPCYPFALTLAALDEEDPLLYETGLRIAADCREAGIHWNLSPVADVNTDPDNPVIGYRAFGSDPVKTASRAVQYFRGLRDGGILSCAKHFPGHGDTATDSHLDLPILRKSQSELAAEEWVPFKALIREDIPAVMTGHLSVPTLDPSGEPSSLSAPIIKDVLRGRLSFKGLVITDALNMYAVSRRHPEKGETAYEAFRAGNDVLCYASDIPEAIALIRSHIPESRIEASFNRFWNLKKEAFRHKRPVLPAYPPEKLNIELGRRCLTLLHAEQTGPTGFFKNDFAAIGSGAQTEIFLQNLRDQYEFPITTWDLSSEDSACFNLPEYNNILLALAPPSHKPPAQFGLSTAALEAIHQLIVAKNVWLYHFGNPYALKLVPYDAAAGAVLAYQNLDSFQDVAAQHFKGEIDAPGVLPVTLNPASA